MEIIGESVDTVSTYFDLQKVDACLEHFLLELRLLCRLLRILMCGIDDLLLACLGIFDADQCAPLF